MIMSIAGPREPHDNRNYKSWVPGTTYSQKGGKEEARTTIPKLPPQPPTRPNAQNIPARTLPPGLAFLASIFLHAPEASSYPAAAADLFFICVSLVSFVSLLISQPDEVANAISTRINLDTVSAAQLCPRGVHLG